MLETEEVDVDYFTPSASTSLSKIFGSSTKEVVPETSSLKYNAPLPPQNVTQPEESKQTQYLFAGTVYAYEWINSSYELRGRLGIAIFKIANSDIYKMVIYDSNKTTLSSLTITHNINIKVNANISISYYDNLNKFWCVNPSSSNLKEILTILKSLNVNLEYLPAVKPVNTTPVTEGTNKPTSSLNKLIEEEKGSDTDCSFSRKTKDSIIKRMASMGQSVLPPPHAAKDQTSDSSDTNEPESQQKPRYKPKVVNKKNLLEKKTMDTDKNSDLNAKGFFKSETTQETNTDIHTINDNKQIVPVTTNVITPVLGVEGNNFDLFIAEQKISNSELKINVNRITDKLDMLLAKVKNLDIDTNNSKASQFQNEIIQKLLNEYEKKINKYEEFIKLKGFECDSFELIPQSRIDSIESLKHTESEDTKLQQICDEKDMEIVRLKEELQILSNRQTQFQTFEKKLIQEINDMKYNMKVTNTTSDNLTMKLEESNKHTTDITNKLKQIMNDTFQAISANFADEENYTGTTIKSIVALVVKKTTINSLKEFNDLS